MATEIGHKKRFVDWFFNNDQLLSQTGTTPSLSMGIAWNDPYDWENELSNPNNDNREWWFRGWWQENNSSGPRRILFENAFRFIYDSNQQRMEMSNTVYKWIPPFDGYFGINNAGTTNPNVYAAPSHFLILRSDNDSPAQNQSEYNDQLLAVIPINNTSNWASGAYFNVTIDLSDPLNEIVEGDGIYPNNLNIAWGA